jgi:hypothetical protein
MRSIDESLTKVCLGVYCAEVIIATHPRFNGRIMRLGQSTEENVNICRVEGANVSF